MNSCTKDPSPPPPHLPSALPPLARPPPPHPPSAFAPNARRSLIGAGVDREPFLQKPNTLVYLDAHTSLNFTHTTMNGHTRQTPGHKCLHTRTCTPDTRANKPSPRAYTPYTHVYTPNTRRTHPPNSCIHTPHTRLQDQSSCTQAQHTRIHTLVLPHTRLIPVHTRPMHTYGIIHTPHLRTGVSERLRWKPCPTALRHCKVPYAAASAQKQYAVTSSCQRFTGSGSGSSSGHAPLPCRIWAKNTPAVTSSR